MIKIKNENKIFKLKDENIISKKKILIND